MLAALTAALALAGESAQPATPPPPPPQLAQQLSAAQMLALAERASAADDLEAAQILYAALERDPVRAVRNEARFRLAALRSAAGDLTGAALLLRRILDEEPGAQRVRLELAVVLQRLGDLSGARRAFREAQAGGLPDDVARVVDGYVSRLRSLQPYGASLEVGIAPDSNINQSTASDRLGTVFGDLVLDDAARGRSGLGLLIDADAHAELVRLGALRFVGRTSVNATGYVERQFGSATGKASVGAELQAGAGQLSMQAGAIARNFGGAPYSRSEFASLDLVGPLGRRAQARAEGSAEAIDNLRNDLQDGHAYSASVGYERALSSTRGAGIFASVERQSLSDAGYSTTSGQLTIFAYQSFGQASVTAAASLGRLAADEALFIYREARSDRIVRLALSLTHRRLQAFGFTPVVRLIAEENASNIAIYDYRRLRSEFALARAF